MLCEEEMFGDVVDRKQAFLDYKKLISILPSHQIRCFLRGCPWFWSKFLKFFIFFRQSSSGKMFGDILDRKQAFLDYKNINLT